jgi:transcriptional regulator with XRE-family HTH domain
MTALGEALRAWRDRVTPAAAGIPGGTERRVPGLRREELAALAGLSVDYLVRLEQGRATNPSPQTISAIARALRLNDNERDLLYRIAGSAPPAPGMVPTHIPAGIQRMGDRLADTPVAMFSAGWTILQWNAMWAALQGDPSRWSGRDRNLAWRHFAGRGSRIRNEGTELASFERGIVADLRAATAKYPEDAELTGLVAALRKASAIFAALWDRFEATPWTSARKTVVHPMLGEIALDCAVLTVSGCDLRVVVYTAEPDTSQATSLELLRVAGIQDLS